MNNSDKDLYQIEEEAISKIVETLVTQGKDINTIELRDNQLNYREVWCAEVCICSSRFHMDNGPLEHELKMNPLKPRLTLSDDDINTRLELVRPENKVEKLKDSVSEFCEKCCSRGWNQTWIDDGSTHLGGYEGPEQYCDCSHGIKLRKEETGE